MDKSAIFKLIFVLGISIATQNISYSQCDGTPMITSVFPADVCAGISFTNASYLTSGSPDQYRIDWLSAGIPNVNWTNLPSGPITISNLPSSPGTYNGNIYVKKFSTGCESEEWFFSINISSPSISVGSVITACQGASFAEVPFTTTGTPTMYRIDWNPQANAAGLFDVGFTNLPSSPLNISNIPSIAGHYVGSLFVITSAGCESPGTPISLDVGASISLVQNSTVCPGSSSTTLAYTVNTGNPDQYHIDWDAAANAAGLTDVSLTTLPPSQITISNIPSTLGTYSGNLFVQNSTVGCGSIGYEISVMVGPTISFNPNIGVCLGASTATFPYLTLGNPDQYSIDWDDPVGGVGITDTPLTSLPSTPGSITISGIPSLYEGVFNGFLKVRNSNCESLAYPISVTILLPGGNISESQIVCSGGNPVAFDGHAASTGPGILTYRWQSSTDGNNWSSIANATGLTYDPPLGLTQTTYYRRATTSNFYGTVCTGYIFVNVFVNNVIGGSIKENQLICPGSTPSQLWQNIPSVGSGSLTYQWERNSDGFWSYISNATGPTYDPTPGLAQSYRLATTSTLNGHQCTAYSNSVYIEVMTITGGNLMDQTICSGGDPSIFLENPGSLGSGTRTYQWQTSIDNITFSNVPNATSKDYDIPPGLTQTSYYKRLTTNFDPNMGVICEATSNTATVNVLPAPTATISSSGPIGFCEGGNVTLNANSGSSYLWSNGATSQSITVSTSGDYSVIVTNSPGCSATSQPTVVTVNPNPTVSISGPSSSCGPASLTASGGTYYFWSGPGVTDPAQNPQPAIQTGTYYVTSYNSYGCASISQASHYIAVNPIPSVSVSGPSSACASTILYASGGSSYSWSGPGVSGGGSSKIIYYTGTYSVTSYNPEGCQSAGSASIYVAINSNPSVSISGPSSACNSTTLTASGGSSYTWSGPGVSGSGSSKTAYYTGWYYITGYSAAGCSSTASKYVTINSTPTVSISKSGSFCPSGYVTLTANATAGSTYYWPHNGATTASTWANAGSKTVQISKNGCSASASYYVAYQNCNGGGGGGGGMPRVGADKPEPAITPDPQQPDVNLLPGIYPNPVNDELNVVLEEPVQIHAEVTLAELSGKVLASKSIEKGENKTTIITENIPDGIYILAILSDSKRKYLKVIVRHGQ
ncbi:MAG: T9SS type A sorting domain-containing protein [Cyclobacteriaceae bacterium]